MSELTNKDVRLVIIARNDIDSMNTGKLAAQASHCASMAAVHAHTSLYQDWAQHNGVGTAIVLEPKVSRTFVGVVNEIGAKVRTLNADYSIGAKTIALYGDWIDPTYPLRDGKFTHYIPFHTCSWFMADYNDLRVADLIQYQKDMCRLYP